jgi:hypothetical protein
MILLSLQDVGIAGTSHQCSLPFIFHQSFSLKGTEWNIWVTILRSLQEEKEAQQIPTTCSCMQLSTMSEAWEKDKGIIRLPATP